MSSTVEAWVTEAGGHLGPVVFDRAGKRWRPFSVAPWAEEKPDRTLPALLRVLRGDFFCLPFGNNTAPYRNERHPPHGETANQRWRLVSLAREGSRSTLHLRLGTRTRPSQVDQQIALVDGHDAVYCRHVISGMKGRMNLGHHAMIKFPDAPGSGRISTSPFVYGQVFPDDFERPEQRGYSVLQPGAEFRSIDEVPARFGPPADLSVYPARRGYEDLVMLVADPALALAWTAVTFPIQRYVWFAIRSPRLLRSTVFWISNGGRHYPPWNGRHVNVMGIEDVTSYFHYGLAESVRRNPLADRGYPTCLEFNPRQPVAIPYVMGVAGVPAGFDRVRDLHPLPARDGILLESDSGKTAAVPLDIPFLDELPPDPPEARASSSPTG